MPYIKKFVIRNFRGIQEAELNIDLRKNSSVITLIGLNESGKTTLLEALSHFSTGDRTIANLLAESRQKEHLISLIPIDKRAAFTGDVQIVAHIGFAPGEYARYVKDAEREFKTKIRAEPASPDLVVINNYSFVDSKYVDRKNLWAGINVRYRKKDRTVQDSRRDDVENDYVWHYIVEAIEKDLYEVVYFPTFIVDMPPRIYLEEHEGETKINLYYRKVIEDVLKSIGEGLDLKTHVVDRLREAKSAAKMVPSWFSMFWGSPDRKLIDAVLHRVQTAINKEVIGSWSKVFKGSVASRSVRIEWNVDASKNDMAYISFGIFDGQSTFSIHERSLGFRWFFSYLLFTQFRSKAGRKTIFLFDEPAANLHAKAQIELLKSIGRIVEGGNKVIYSTHSPHMINPEWLTDAFIVENRAVDLDRNDDILGLDTKSTDVKAISYGKFVSEYPEKSTYFQPVWEKLLYDNPPIVGKGPYLCVEGISDFHFLLYVMRQSGKEYGFSIVPGVGSGGFRDTLPGLYGVGAPFLLLLDDDKQGRLERDRYIEQGILAKTQVYTLGVVGSDFETKKLETLMSTASLELVKQRFDGASGKKQVSMYLAEIAASSTPRGLAQRDVEAGTAILDWVAGQMQAFTR